MGLNIRFLADDPIERSDLDTLGFGQFADRLYAALVETPTPYVYGLPGPWGSGKTSVQELLAARFREDLPKANAAKVYVPIWFDTRRYENLDNMISRVAMSWDYSPLGICQDNPYSSGANARDEASQDSETREDRQRPGIACQNAALTHPRDVLSAGAVWVTGTPTHASYERVDKSEAAEPKAARVQYTARMSLPHRQEPQLPAEAVTSELESGSSDTCKQSGTPDHVQADIDALLASFRLQKLRRYFHQRFWEPETREAEYSDRLEGTFKLENVAAHSWHIADAALILATNFAELNVERCVMLALLHDKLEMYTGDFNPVGRDGTGAKTHAFNADKQENKHAAELRALDYYLDQLQPRARPLQRELLLEAIRAETPESRFIKSVDKLQALAYVHLKKAGNLNDMHLRFTLDYSSKSIDYFPEMAQHYLCLRARLLEGICKRRNISYSEFEKSFFAQSELQFE